jgi:hypothetical protein
MLWKTVNDNVCGTNLFLWQDSTDYFAELLIKNDEKRNGYLLSNNFIRTGMRYHRDDA